METIIYNVRGWGLSLGDEFVGDEFGAVLVLRYCGVAECGGIKKPLQVNACRG